MFYEASCQFIMYMSCSSLNIYLFIFLGVVCTMDHEVIPRPCKISDWLLNSSRFNSHQGKKVRVTMGFEVPKRHVLRPTLFIDTVQHVL